MMGGMGTPAEAGDALAAQGHTPCLPEPTGRCGPDSGGPDSDGPDSSGPDSSGRDSSGPDSSGPDSGGPDSAGPDTGPHGTSR
jgi:hypothetical protein